MSSVAAIGGLYAVQVQPHAPTNPSIGRRAAAAHAWQRRSSPLSRYALLAYLLVVIDASLYPFSGWHDVGLSPYAYLAADWFPHALPFDLIVNGIGYLPLGFAGALALHPRVRGTAAVLVTTLLCVVLSMHLEALQTYLPSRVASKVDVLANGAGGLVGALLGARFAHVLLDTGRLRVWRTRWFAPDASRGLVLIVVWFGALVYPEAFALGTGGLLKAFDPTASDLLATAAGLSEQGDAVATALRFEFAESAVTGLTLFAAGALLLNLLRPGLAWPRRFALLAAFVVASVVVEASAHAFLIETSWPLLSRGAQTGIAIGVLALMGSMMLPLRLRWALSLAAFAGALALVNVYPDNPYGNPVRLAWTRGKLLNFYGLASGINLVWPYLAIGYLFRHRGSAAAASSRSATPPRRMHGRSSL